MLCLPDPADDDVQRAVQLESVDHGDILQSDSLVDTYHNLTYKALSALQWIADHCAGARYVLKVDDDVFVDFFNLELHLRDFDRRLAGATGATAATAAASADKRRARNKTDGDTGIDTETPIIPLPVDIGKTTDKKLSAAAAGVMLCF